MNTPPLLLGAALIFRGWLAGPLVLAAVVALVLEAPRLVQWRLDITRKEFALVWNVCVVLFIAIAVYFIATVPISSAVTAMVRWSPVAMLPMMAAVAYSVDGKVDLDVLSIVSRRKVRREGESGRTAVTLAYPFLVLCLLSASAAGERTPWFYAGVVVLSAWALWGARSRSGPAITWLALLAVAGALGYAGHINLHRLQGVVEQVVADWYTPSRSDEGEVDPRYAAIGSVESRKLSNHIVLRVELPEGRRTPVLLREAAYNTYRSQIWTAQNSLFEPVKSDGNGAWRLGATQEAKQAITVHASLGKGEKVLPLPLHTALIEGLQAARMSRSRLGTVKVEDGPDFADYQVSLGDAGDPPTDQDVAIPQNEAPVLARIAAELGLKSSDTDGSVEALAGFFRDQFQYSLVQPGEKGDMPLSKFLLSKKAGHCEYFATATVLMLRAAGIPARYAVGYSVQEYSDLERMYIVRSRHAHAWCLVYAGGAWRDFDTTPPAWSAMENTRSPMIGYIHDLWQRMVFLFSRWRIGLGADWFRTASAWGLFVIIIYVAWKLFRKQRVRSAGQGYGLKAATGPGRDSEFYAVEKRLKEQGFLRQPWEPTSAWLRKIQQRRMLSGLQNDLLRDLFALHDRYRFDPNSITPAEREALRVSAKRWLEAEQLNERTTGSASDEDSVIKA
jgi:transglutaminase-like putative cysteine protease/uncharacterized membrane protein YozB (DUF420 family)